MSALPLGQLLQGVAAVPAPRAGREVRGLTLDSRAVVRDGVFVALAGARTHGVAYAQAARDAGALLILVEAPLPVDIAPAEDLVVVDGLRSHLGELALRYFGDAGQRLPVIGVTGTNGKTSTVQLLAQALDACGLGPCGHIGTLGVGLAGELQAGERTTPDVLSVHAALNQLAARGARALAMEVSSHALDQGRVDGIRFAVAVFTNLTRDHLDYHLDMQAYGEAKARLFSQHAPAAAVINIDDPFGAELAARLPDSMPCWSSSATGKADARLQAHSLRLDARGLAFMLREADAEVAVRSPLVGRFNVDNLLAVAGSLRALGLPLVQVATLLQQLQPVRGRMNRIGAQAEPLVVVDYAHTPDALEQALRSLRAHTVGRLVCVFGCGGERDRGKRPQMAAIAERLADHVLVTDDNPRGEDGDAIVADILGGFGRPEAVQVQRDRALAIAAAIGSAAANDTVLIAGKGHETYQEIGGRKLPFDDAAVAAACLRERAA